LERAEINEEWAGGVQVDAQSRIIQSMHADERAVLELATIVFRRVLEEEKLPGIVRGGIRIERPQPGINKVVSRDRFTRGPDEI